MPETSSAFNDEDVWLAAGFAWAQRPLEASLSVLYRLVVARDSAPSLLQAVLQPQVDLNRLAQQAGLTGRKALVVQLRASILPQP